MTGVLQSTWAWAWAWAYGLGQETWGTYCQAVISAGPARTTAGTGPDPERPGEDRRVVQCNYTGATRIAVRGARAYLVRPNPGGGDDRIVILARSRSGRWVEKWEAIGKLGNFRVKTLPPGHPLYGDGRIWDHEPEAMAARLADRSAAA